MIENKSRFLNLSLVDSARLKGIALMLLLWHHLFSGGGNNFEEWFVAGKPIIQQTASISKVCVSLFVFLSGYGLAIQTQKYPLGYLVFLKKRLKKLMVNYWLIWLLFIPWGFIFFGFSLDSIYGEQAGLKLIFNFLGIQNILGYYGINPTWWFYSLIMVLYLLFPLLYRLTDSSLHVIILLLFSALLVLSPSIPYGTGIEKYLISFVLGISLAKWNVKFSSFYLCKKNNILFLVLLIIFVMLWRQGGPFFKHIKVDSILTVLIVMLYYCTLAKLNNIFTHFLEFCGKHSFNIFLFHTFIYYIYFPGQTYFLHNPFFIFISLLSVCLLLSTMIEKVKKRWGLA